MAREDLTEYQFAVGLLAALARQGITKILPPELDMQQLSDRAAAVTWKHLDENYEEVFDCRFCIYTHPIYRDSGSWRSTLHDCGRYGLLVPEIDTRMLRLEPSKLERQAAKVPGNRAIWDLLAKVFLEEYKRAQYS